jgi:hypothetical protein
VLAHGRWFSPASSTTKTGRHDIAEILLKVALNTINQIKSNLLNPGHDNVYFNTIYFYNIFSFTQYSYLLVFNFQQSNDNKGAYYGRGMVYARRGLQVINV